MKAKVSTSSRVLDQYRPARAGPAQPFGLTAPEDTRRLVGPTQIGIRTVAKGAIIQSQTIIMLNCEMREKTRLFRLHATTELNPCKGSEKQGAILTRTHFVR